MTKPDRQFWHNKRVLVTGHTGFKGSWASAWLMELGALVSGYALDPVTEPNLCDLLALDFRHDIRDDIRHRSSLNATIEQIDPEIVLHMAAQPLVRLGYEEPIETLETNIMGTAHLLDALRGRAAVQAIIVVTSDKAYDNEDYDPASQQTEQARKFVESDRLGGKDPYSASKGGQELVTRSYAFSWFDPAGIPLVSARAGNVIGGGDWSKDRLMTDILGALGRGDSVMLRNPLATRPWQHVLEPVAGYLLYAQALAQGKGRDKALNFGPAESHTVETVTDKLLEKWPGAKAWTQDPETGPKEAHSLEIDARRAWDAIQWQPRLDLDTCLQWIVDWHQACDRGADMTAMTRQQIAEFETLMVDAS